MSRCVPDTDDLPCGGLSRLQENKYPSFVDADRGFGSPCWSDCGVWDVEIDWVDGRPRVVPAPPSTGFWEDVSLEPVFDQGTGSTLFDHPTPVVITSSGKDLNVEPQQDALVPVDAGRDNKPTVVENPSTVDPACTEDGKPSSAARKEQVPPVVLDEIVGQGERIDMRRKGIDHGVGMARSTPAKRRRAAADHHNLVERRRRDKFNQNLRKLQRLIPDSNAKADQASVLDEVISYTRRLQSQVDMMAATFSPTMMMAMSMMNPLAGFSSLPYVGLAPGGSPYAGTLTSHAQQIFFMMNSSAMAAQVPHQNNNGTANDPRASGNP